MHQACLSVNKVKSRLSDKGKNLGTMWH
uniref:Uncharacterized protein n=1 Tax=Arundo donax TaxID=35708 RepID=A0A0A9HNN0_ARUDO